MAETKFAAFISYSHKDEVVARWLHRRLEGYAIPRGAAPGYGRKGLFGRRIGRVFRDREELPAGYPLTDKINEALAQSGALIVLCSPNSASSEYVNKEIVEFQRLGKGNRIFPMIVHGDDHEIFPAALSEKREILEADMRAGKDGRDQAALKLMAGLINLEPYDLTRREARAQTRRLAFAGAAIAVFAGLAVIAGWFWFQSVRSNSKLEAANLNLSQTNRRLSEALTELGISSERLSSANRTLEQRSRDLALALTQVRFERDNSQRSRSLAEQRRIEAETALVQAQRARDEAVLANNRARATLHRFFFTNGEQALDAADPFLAIRYALAGRQLSPENAAEYEVLMTRAYSIVGRHQVLEPRVTRDQVAAVTPDGQEVISVNSTGEVTIWDRYTKLITLEYFLPEISNHAAAISADGRLIALGNSDGLVTVWNAKTGQQVGAPMQGDVGMVTGLKFSDDGSRLISWTISGSELRLWSTGSSKLLHSIPTQRVTDAAISLDGRLIVSAGRIGLRLWSADSGQQIGASLIQEDTRITTLAISPDGRRFAAGNRSGVIELWDTTTFQRVGSPMIGGRGEIVAASFSPDGKLLVSGNTDGFLNFWDAEAGMEERASIRGSGDGITSIVFTPDRYSVISAGFHDVLRVWNLEEEPATEIDQLSHYYGRVIFSPDGRRKIVRSGTNYRLINVDTDQQIGADLNDIESVAGPISFSRNGRYFVSWNIGDGRIRAWDADTGRPVGLALSHKSRTILALAVSSDGRRVVSSDVDGEIILWDTSSGSRLRDLRTEGRFLVSALAFSPTDDQIAAGHYGGALRVWSARTDDHIGMEFSGRSDGISKIVYSPDGTRILSWDNSSNSIRQWGVDERAQIDAPLTGHDNPVEAVAFSSDGRLIVSGGRDATIRLWNARTGQQVGLPLLGHDRQVNAVAFSSNGRRVLSWGSLDGGKTWDVGRLVQGWDVMAREACLTMLGRSGRVFSREEIEADPLLFSEWNDPIRDVCAGVSGVPALSAEGGRR